MRRDGSPGRTPAMLGPAHRHAEQPRGTGYGQAQPLAIVKHHQSELGGHVLMLRPLFGT
jgi:hypothetical protein